MTTPQDFTTRVRDDLWDIYNTYQSLAKRINDLNDEVTAKGGVNGIYGAGGSNFPAQADGFVLADIVAAFTNVLTLIGTPSTAQKQTLIKCRRD